MINAIGSSGLARAIDAARSDKVKAPAPAAEVDTTSTDASAGIASPAAVLARYGVPIDSAKVAAIRAQMQAGSYRVDPEAIAARMIATDLPRDQ